jgi:hypothetical protein
MKSTGARRLARATLGATRRWIAAGCATAQWKARFARRYPPPTPALAGDPNPSSLDQPLQAKHHHIDPRKQIPGGRHQIGIPGGFNSESVAGFLSECLAGFLGIRRQKIAMAVAAGHRRRGRPAWAATVEKLNRRAERPLDRVLVTELARRSSDGQAARCRPLRISPWPVSSSSRALTAPSSSVPILSSRP